MERLRRVARAAQMTGASFRSAIRSPGDAVLTLRVALFVVHLPRTLGRRDVGSFLRELRALPRPAAPDVQSSVARVRRISRAVLSLPRFWRWDTCYVRALILYRFVDAKESEMRLHFGIEQRGRDERLHGHAWLTLAGELLEAPADVMLANVREMPLEVSA
jgi:hypothetical protein